MHRTTGPLPYARPLGRYGPRRISSGGLPARGRVAVERRSMMPGGRGNDAKIFKARGPFFRVGNLIPIPDPIRPTDSGPARPTMWQKTAMYRRWSGASNTHNMALHTYLDDTMKNSLTQGTNHSGMRATRMNRLTVQQFRGQSYSQLTQSVGG